MDKETTTPQTGMGKFKYWFTQVFWYHYKWHTLASIIALILAISLFSTILSKDKPDYEMTFVAPYTVLEEDLSAIKVLLREQLRDINENGKFDYLINVIVLNDDSDNENYMATALQKLNVLFATEENKLFIMDGKTADRYLQLLPFLKGSDIGIDFDGEKIPLGKLCDKGLLASFQGGEYFALVKEEGVEPKNRYHYYEPERRIIEAIRAIDA